MEINKLTIKDAQRGMEKGEFTSVELTEACLDCIEKNDKEINAILTVCREDAMRDAKSADERRKSGEKGYLLGIPFVAKDVIMTKNVRSTGGSKILENYVAPYDATVVKKLKEAGAVLVGKGNCDEFGHGGSGENSAYGPTRNPWDTTRVPGGSSSGSVAAVATGMCLFALGTDTGGSTRFPAGLCNMVGLKPTYGRNSRFGLMSMTSSTDTVAPVTRTIEDLSAVMKIMAGHDKNDATTSFEEVPDYNKSLNKDIKGLKIGIPVEFVNQADKNVLEKFNEALEKLEELGAKIMPIELPHAKYGIPVYYIITPAEISSNLAKLDGIRYGLSEEGESIKEIYFKTRGRGFGPEVKRRIMMGTYALSAGYYDSYYLQAQKVRTKIKEEFDSNLKIVDAIMMPTQPGVAFKIGHHGDDILKMYLEDIFLSPASLAGLPAVSIPCGFADNLPVGAQIIGKRFNEEMLFRIGSKYQENTDWHEKYPEV